METIKILRPVLVRHGSVMYPLSLLNAFKMKLLLLHGEYSAVLHDVIYKGQEPTWQFWDPGGVKLDSLCNFSIVGCQWTVNCLQGIEIVS